MNKNEIHCRYGKNCKMVGCDSLTVLSTDIFRCCICQSGICRKCYNNPRYRTAGVIGAYQDRIHWHCSEACVNITINK